MSDSARFALHRPEFLDALVRGEEKIARLMSGNDHALAAGKTLIEAGSEHAFVYRLRKGWAGRMRQLGDGRNQCILIFLPQDLFAVKSMFFTRHPDAVKLLSDAVVERVHYQELHRAYVEDGDIASLCMWQVMEEERRLHSWVVSLGQGSAEERLAMLLVDLHGRLAVSGAIAHDALTFEMPMTQTQLADHLGLTAIHVNRVLKVFRQDGVVTIRDGMVSIGSLESLAKRAYPLLDTHERTVPEYVGALHRGSAAAREERH
jgi:CRP/FNR family transcriptional regulator, anaerobic regulatory protein